MKSENKIIGAGMLTAITASLCCITPVLALIAGTSGIASTFSWVDPFRPYLIGLTVLALGFAWYQKLFPKETDTQKEIDCECATDEKRKFIQTKTFLGIATLFAVTMISFPDYAHIFYPKSEKEIVIVKESNIQKVEFSIDGMTCTSCAEHVQHEVNKLPGIIVATASYEDKNAVVEFDSSKTTLADIQKAIDGTGYKVIETNIK
ncbi:mercuric transport protein MerTP [Algoriphagus aquimarinus]|uniref:Mercuric transport protein MerT n=1 Tax=Algoriphagus aquimarinus TaxID=237018 RepID=A0A5C7B3X7_9BACT|nr:mercuric transport protein MerTP [Algoriphagus aquimarinus]TXE13275.1 mercuric transport protein MerTP [Algoriphagus aquimarinus]